MEVVITCEISLYLQIRQILLLSAVLSFVSKYFCKHEISVSFYYLFIFGAVLFFVVIWKRNKRENVSWSYINIMKEEKKKKIKWQRYQTWPYYFEVWLWGWQCPMGVSTTVWWHLIEQRGSSCVKKRTKQIWMGQFMLLWEIWLESNRIILQHQETTGINFVIIAWDLLGFSVINADVRIQRFV